MNYYYKVFDLILDSCIELPEAVRIDTPDNVDVVVSFGDTYLDETDKKYFFIKRNPQQIIINSMAAVFEVCDGKTITVGLKEGYDERLLRIFLLGSALGAVQYQLGYLPLHGGAIVANDGAIIITGNSGAGKSTMTSTLVGLGYKYLTDDVSGVFMENSVPYVLPAYPQRKLIRDACISLGYDPDTLPVADKDRDKFAIRDPERWRDTPAPLSMILELVRAEEGQPLSVAPLNAIERIRVIKECLYRSFYHMENGIIPPREMKRLLEVASVAQMHTVYVPKDIDNIEKLAKQMAALLHFDK